MNSTSLQPTTESSLAGVWPVLLAAMLWGTTGTSQGLAPAGVTPATIGAARLLVGGTALLLLAAARGGLKQSWPVGKVLLGGAWVAAYQLTFFAGVARTGVAVGTLVAIGSSPIFAGILGFLLRGERLGRRWLVATVLAVAGSSLLALAGGELRIDFLGLLLALGAGFSYVAYTLSLKGLLERFPTDAVTAMVFSCGAMFLLPLLFTGNLGWLARPGGIAVVLHLGLLATALSYWLFARGLQLVKVGTAATLSLAEPLTAGVLGVTVLGEQLTLKGFLGIGLIFFGLLILSVRRAPKRVEAHPVG